MFCSGCGNKVGTSATGTIKDSISKASDVAINTAKTIGNRVNDATGGKAGEFVQNAQEKAKEAAENYTADVKEAVNKKDYKGFFTKNHFRNTIITVAVVAVGILILSLVFGGSDSSKKKTEKNTSKTEKTATANKSEDNKTSDYSSTRTVDFVDSYIGKSIDDVINQIGGRWFEYKYPPAKAGYFLSQVDGIEYPYCGDRDEDAFSVKNGKIVAHVQKLKTTLTVRDYANHVGLDDIFSVEPVFLGKLRGSEINVFYWNTSNGYFVLYCNDIPWEDYLGDNIFEVAGATDLEYLIMDIE